MKKIGTKLWIGMMVLVVCMLLLLWLFQVVFLEKFYMSMQINKLESRSEQIVSNLMKQEGDLSKVQVMNMRDELEAFVYTYNTSVQIIDATGEIVFQMDYNNEQPFSGMNRRQNTQILNNTLNGKKDRSLFKHPRFDIDYLTLGVPIMSMDTSQVQGALLIMTTMAPVSDTAGIIKHQLIYITAILLLVAFGIAYMISYHLSQPIMKINRAAQEIAQGNWDIHMNKMGEDEIGQLAETIKNMAVSLKKTDKLRKELIGNISHELRTPLSLIRGYAETIRDISGKEQEKREGHLEIIIDESERLGRLIDDILNLSQLEVDGIKLKQEPIDIKVLFDSIKNRFMDLAQKKAINLEVILGDAQVGFGDYKRIEQVMINLVGNAFNHTPSNGHIFIKTNQIKNYINIEVINEGVEIREEDLEHIWDRYYKVNRVTDENSIGSGLGLAIVKNILHAHKVDFGVESHKGGTTVFWFQLNRGDSSIKK
ncbi:sensor histidine kinase [Petrocella sp. FN5]|uniref:sensor histidine kinase n=1 Tax=Petrocella sp. FN5 TaxID=3032002 RepID=UPI0023DAC1C0|nr:HAMP domain-containing sensor histidine kinase [Petrocella sp. FN5]MDF1616081.1 HAMP domain-containing sensor histidine kinase [Petrocella sp. FN5]